MDIRKHDDIHCMTITCDIFIKIDERFKHWIGPGLQEIIKFSVLFLPVSAFDQPILRLTALFRFRHRRLIF